MRGSLLPTITDDGTAIDFLTADGARAIRHDTLLVTDATGQPRPAQFELSPAMGGDLPGIRILVDAREAVYPVVVDPLVTSPAWSTESNQAYAYFGYSVPAGQNAIRPG